MGEDDPTVVYLEKVGGQVHGYNGKESADVSVAVRESDLEEPWRSARQLLEGAKKVLQTHDPAWGVGEQRDRMVAIRELKAVVEKAEGYDRADE